MLVNYVVADLAVTVSLKNNVHVFSNFIINIFFLLYNDQNMYKFKLLFIF